MPKFDIKEYARRGAEMRAAELSSELDEIYRAFPDLRRRGGGAGGARAARGGRSPKRRRTMTAAQRKEVSVRMRKYWAERRKAKQAK